MLTLPGLIDPHVHMREPGACHKEDWDSGTAAALAGGFTTVLAMPNTSPPLTDRQVLRQVQRAAREKARCDFGLFAGATADNAREAAGMAGEAAGLKMYLDNTYGPLKLEGLGQWTPHFDAWPAGAPGPIAVHAEGRSLAAAVLLAQLHRRPVHLCHISREEEVLLVRRAKEQGLPVTCEVTPHHLLLCEDDLPRLGHGRGRVAPALARASDRQALWDNLDVIDCFATDHAPHAAAEKDGESPPPGFPGLEAALPLLLTAVREGRLTLEDLVLRMVDNPRRIFGLPPQPDTFVEVDPDAGFELRASELRSRCGWTPYEGARVFGRVRRVVLRGQEALRDGQVTAAPGSGRDVRGAPCR